MSKLIGAIKSGLGIRSSVRGIWFWVEYHKL